MMRYTDNRGWVILDWEQEYNYNYNHNYSCNYIYIYNYKSRQSTVDRRLKTRSGLWSPAPRKEQEILRGPQSFGRGEPLEESDRLE